MENNLNLITPQIFLIPCSAPTKVLAQNWHRNHFVNWSQFHIELQSFAKGLLPILSTIVQLAQVQNPCCEYRFPVFQTPQTQNPRNYLALYIHRHTLNLPQIAYSLPGKTVEFEQRIHDAAHGWCKTGVGFSTKDIHPMNTVNTLAQDDLAYYRYYDLAYYRYYTSFGCVTVINFWKILD